MKTDKFVYMNGEYKSYEDAKISVFDHGLLYGDGIFEGIRAYNGRLFKLEEHIRRFFEGAKAVMLDLPLGFEEVVGVVCETCRRNGIVDGYVRLVATRGMGDLGLSPSKCKGSFL